MHEKANPTPTLTLFLLGSPRVEQDGESVKIPRHKALALLAYLAITGERVGRDTLATMLWPEADASHARGALRRALADIGKALDKPLFETIGDSLALQSADGLSVPGNIWVDAHSFHALVAASIAHPHPADTPCAECQARLTEATSLYRDDFMQGFTLPDCPRFDEWQFFQTESYRQELALALERLVQYSRKLGDTPQALAFARRWCGLDPLLQAPQRAVMELYATSGQQAAAMRQYHGYVRLLEEELDSKPSQDLELLADQIRRGDIAAASGQQVGIGATGGTALESDEIRLVTVLYAGLGYLSSDADPDALQESASALERIVTHAAALYAGHVGPFLAEGVQVLFGYPQMHEDDPERALRTAVEIQGAAKERHFAISVGISTGRAYFGQRTAGASQITTIGPVVGLATRLQAHARPDHIWVSESTFRHAQGAGKFTAASIAAESAAGPVRAFQLVNLLARPDKVRGIEGMRAALIGRDEDLASAVGAVDAVLKGRGGLLSIEGEAGIGKSRLVEELAHRAQRSSSGSLLWIESRCSEFSSTVPYAPFVELMGRWLDGVGEHEVTRALALENVLKQLVADGALASQTRDEIAPFLANLLSGGTPGSDANWGDNRPELVLHQTFRAVHDLLVALARRQPLVLVFEDLQWADALSLDLLAFLMDTIASNAILFVCVNRPAPVPKLKRLSTLVAAKYTERFVRVTLRELTPAQSREMVRSMLRIDELPLGIDDIIGQVWGNPFFVEETVRALIQSGSLYRSDGGWSVRGMSALPVPESIQSVILSRIDRLPPEDKRVLSTAAVIGRLFQPTLLERVLTQGTEVDQALNRLEEMALVYQDRVIPQVTYSFKHVLTQEAVYQTLSRQQREEMHLQVATAIEQLYSQSLHEHYEELAHHYSQARATDKAIEFLVRAGSKARRAFLNQAAIQYFDQALQFAETARQDTASIAGQIEALTGLGRIRFLMGDPGEAERNLRQALELGQKARLEPRAQARIHYWLGQVLHWQGRYGEQMWLGEAGMAQLPEGQTGSAEAAMMNHMIASGSMRRGDRDQFHALAEQNAGLLDQLPYSEELPSLYEHVIFSLSDQKQMAEARRWLEKLENLAILNNDSHARALVRESVARQSLAQGRLQEAALALAEAVNLYSNIGDRINLWRCLDGSVWISLLQGDLDAADEKAWEALNIADKWRFHRIESESQLGLAVLSTARQDWQRGTQQFHAAIELGQGSDPFWTEWAGMYGLGQLALAEGNKQQAQHYLQAALLHFSPQLVPLGWEQHRWWSLSACILSALERACADPEHFRAFCDNLEEFKLQHAMPPIPMQWYGEPATPDDRFSNLGFRFPSGHSVSPHPIENKMQDWRWLDPVGDSTHSLSRGIEMRAANGRDLWYLNRSSPRLLRSISGEWAIEASCSRPEPDRPAMGGLVLSKGETNMLRLVWGTRGAGEISFEGCIDDTDLIVGRAQLPVADPASVRLRLERSEDQVRGLASADGKEWISLGRVAFPVADPLEIGVLAIGWIDRTIYPGAFPNGTAICFDSIEIKRD